MPFNSEENQSSSQDDYYTFLGVSRNATDTEITNAYRRLSRLYHPDKHQDADKKESANILFNRAKKAYETLKDPKSRAVYDTLGEKAMENEVYEIVKYYGTPEEIREKYEKMAKEKEEQQLKKFLNPQASVSIDVNAVDLFKPQRRTRRRRKHSLVRMSSMGLTASIDFPVNYTNKLNFTGLVTTAPEDKTSNHTVTFAIDSTITPTLQTNVQLAAGQGGGFLKLKGKKNITERDIVSGKFVIFSRDLLDVFGEEIHVFSKEIDYVHLLSKHLAVKMGLKSDLINDSSLTTALTYSKDKNKIDFEFQLGLANSYLSMAYIRSLEINNTKLKTKVTFGLAGSSVEYGCETQLTKHSILDASVEIGNVSGVALKMKCYFSGQSYSFNILMSDEIVPAPIVYGTVCPMIAFLCVKKYLIIPYQEMIKKQKETEVNRDELRRVFEKKRDAELSIQLMQDAYLRSVQVEETKDHGLIIELAIYGNAENLTEFVNENLPSQASDLNSQKEELSSRQLTLVTIPLQCLIKDSVLSIPDASKINLPGFYDPCPSKEKKLFIRYKFRNARKDLYFFDNDKIRLPLFN